MTTTTLPTTTVGEEHIRLMTYWIDCAEYRTTVDRPQTMAVAKRVGGMAPVAAPISRVRIGIYYYVRPQLRHYYTNFANSSPIQTSPGGYHVGEFGRSSAPAVAVEEGVVVIEVIINEEGVLTENATLSIQIDLHTCSNPD